MGQLEDISPRILSPREEQIVDLSSQGLTDKEIAHKLAISTGTLNTYWNRVRRKLKGTSRTELATSLLKLKTEGRLKELEAEAELLKQNLNKLSRSKAQIEAELHTKEDSLARADAQHKAAMLLIDEGVVAMSAEGIIESFSPAAEEIFGYREEEVVGKPISMLMSEQMGKRHQVYVDRHIATGHARILGMGRPVEAITASGETIEVHIEVRKILAASQWSFVAIIKKV